MLGAALLGACARPQGVLFEPIVPAKVWPAPPDVARVRLVGTLSGSADLKAGRSGGEALRAALRGPRPPLSFSRPQGVAFRDPALLAVADGGQATVHVLDLDARTHVRIAGFGDERLGSPFGVTWAQDRLFVTDAQRGEVIEFDRQGSFRRRFGGDVLRRPVGIAYVAERDLLYVVSGGTHCLAVFTPDGKLVDSFGSRGTGPGQFNYPTHVCWHDGRLLVTDSGNCRVQLLGPDGSFVRSIGQKGDGAGDFALPKGVAVDGDGHLYVVDAQFENVQVFDGEGRLLMAFGEEGQDPGEFWLPTGIAVGKDDRIWVADGGNRRIQVFEYVRAAL